MVGFFEYVIENFGLYWRGFLVMVRLALLSFVLASVVGLLLASFRVSPVGPLRRFSSAYTSFFRNTPLLALFFLAFFGLPALGIVYSPFTTATVVLGLYTGAYMGETVRSGINSVDKGQAEAARAIGLDFRRVLTLVVLPQALRTVVPPVSNLFIANAKNASIAIAIGVVELTAVTQRLIDRTGQALEAVGGAALFYVVFLVVIQQGVNFVEGRLEIKR